MSTKLDIIHGGVSPSKDAITSDTQKELATIEEKLGIKINELTFPQLITMKDRLQVEEILFGRILGTSVLSTIVQGADYYSMEGRVGRQIATLVPFDGNYPTARLPTLGSPTYADVKHGLHVEGPWYGKEPSYVEFDAQKQDAWHSLALGVDITAIRDQRWNLVQRYMTDIGKAFTDHENRDVVMGFDTATTEAWDTNAWNTIVNAVATLETAGCVPDFMVIGPTGKRLAMKLDQFIHAQYLGAAGKVMQTGQIGEMMDIGNVYRCRHVDSLPAEGGKAVWAVIGRKDAAVGLAIRDDLFLDEFHDPLKGLEGGVARERYVIKIIDTTMCIQLLAA